MFNPLKALGGFVTGKVIRPTLRTLAGEAGVELRRKNTLKRKAAVAAVAYAAPRRLRKPAPAAAPPLTIPSTPGRP